MIPAWMFDAAACAHMVLGPPRASIRALAELRALLGGEGSDRDIAANERREGRDGHNDEEAGCPGVAAAAIISGCIATPSAGQRKGHPRKPKGSRNDSRSPPSGSGPRRNRRGGRQ
jgi:hypothetical protein